MIWRSIRRGMDLTERYAIRSGCGTWTICSTSGRPPYLLWRGSTTEAVVAQLCGRYATAELAKAAAECMRAAA